MQWKIHVGQKGYYEKDDTVPVVMIDEEKEKEDIQNRRHNALYQIFCCYRLRILSTEYVTFLQRG